MASRDELPSPPLSQTAFDRAAVESFATALVARRIESVDSGLAAAEAMTVPYRGVIRSGRHGERPIEVHIDRVEVVRPAPTAAPLPQPPPPRPRHRGFSALAATRGHLRRCWY
jgi:hypothetical protein